jgi:hypothetical protein
MTQGQQQIIIEITQSVIAVLIVAGLGFAILTGNSHVNDVLPVLMAVVGFYFGRQVPTASPSIPPVVTAATNAAAVATTAAVTATNAAAVATNAATTATTANEAQLAVARAAAVNAKTTGEIAAAAGENPPKAV